MTGILNPESCIHIVSDRRVNFGTLGENEDLILDVISKQLFIGKVFACL